MEHSMSNPMFKYTSNKRNKNGGVGVLYPYASLLVQFKGLHQITLLYCSILRPSQHQPFSSSTPHFRVLPWHKHTQETLFSSYMDEEFFSNLSIFWAGKTTFTGLSAAVDTLLDSFHRGFGTTKPHNEAQLLQTRAVSSPFWSASSLAWVFVLRPLFSASSPLQAGPL